MTKTKNLNRAILAMTLFTSLGAYASLEENVAREVHEIEAQIGINLPAITCRNQASCDAQLARYREIFLPLGTRASSLESIEFSSRNSGPDLGTFTGSVSIIYDQSPAQIQQFILSAANAYTEASLISSGIQGQLEELEQRIGVNLPTLYCYTIEACEAKLARYRDIFLPLAGRISGLGSIRFGDYFQGPTYFYSGPEVTIILDHNPQEIRQFLLESAEDYSRSMLSSPGIEDEIGVLERELHISLPGCYGMDLTSCRSMVSRLRTILLPIKEDIKILSEIRLGDTNRIGSEFRNRSSLVTLNINGSEEEIRNFLLSAAASHQVVVDRLTRYNREIESLKQRVGVQGVAGCSIHGDTISFCRDLVAKYKQIFNPLRNRAPLNLYVHMGSNYERRLGSSFVVVDRNDSPSNIRRYLIRNARSYAQEQAN